MSKVKITIEDSGNQREIECNYTFGITDEGNGIGVFESGETTAGDKYASLATCIVKSLLNDCKQDFTLAQAVMISFIVSLKCALEEEEKNGKH